MSQPTRRQYPLINYLTYKNKSYELFEENHQRPRFRADQNKSKHKLLNKSYSSSQSLYNLTYYFEKFYLTFFYLCTIYVCFHPARLKVNSLVREHSHLTSDFQIGRQVKLYLILLQGVLALCEFHYREFLPYANFITANFFTAVFQNHY